MNINKFSLGLPTQLTSYCPAMSKHVLPICTGLLAFAQTAFAGQQEDEHSTTSTTNWPAICLTIGLGALTLLAMRFLRRPTQPAILPSGVLPQGPIAQDDHRLNSSLELHKNDTETSSSASSSSSSACSSTPPMEWFKGRFLEAAHFGNNVSCGTKERIKLPISPTVRDLKHRIAELRDVIPAAVTIHVGGHLDESPKLWAQTGSPVGGRELTTDEELDQPLSSFGNDLIQFHYRCETEYCTNIEAYQAAPRNPLILPAMCLRSGQLADLELLTMESSVEEIFTALASQMEVEPDDLILHLDNKLISVGDFAQNSANAPRTLKKGLSFREVLSNFDLDVATVQVNVFKRSDVVSLTFKNTASSSN